MKYFLAGIIALLALASVNAARAADMPLKAPPPASTPASSWTGFYLGGQLGYDYSRSPSTYTLDPANPFLAGLFVPAVTTGTLASSTSQSGGGFLGGVTAGYNIQTGIVVWGVEADFDGVGNQHTSSVAPTPALAFPTLTTRTNTQTDWLATVREPSRRDRVSGYADFWDWRVGRWAHCRIDFHYSVGGGVDVCDRPLLLDWLGHECAIGLDRRRRYRAHVRGTSDGEDRVSVLQSRQYELRRYRAGTIYGVSGCPQR
jgi:opacity protein-like surface antigen